MKSNNAMGWVLRSKIHQAVVTEANVAYCGSIAIDECLLEKVGLWAGEKVLVVSNTSGARLETYVLIGERGIRQNLSEWCCSPFDSSRGRNYYHGV